MKIINVILRHKLFWSIIFILLGLLVFIGVHQYIGAAIVGVGLILVEMYSDERKAIK